MREVNRRRDQRKNEDKTVIIKRREKGISRMAIFFCPFFTFQKVKRVTSDKWHGKVMKSGKVTKSAEKF
jgi:hypothetical protein